MNYAIQFEKAALKELYKLPEKYSNQIAKDIDDLSRDPRPRGYKKLKGSHDLFRIRSGNYRVIYRIYDTILIIIIVKISDRKVVYR